MTNSDQTFETHPVAVIGAGPVGLAAAAHLLERGLSPVVFEQSDAVGSAIRDWGHVRVFTPWAYLIDSAARRILDEDGWTEPHRDHLPTGDEIRRDYLEPLAASPSLRTRLRLSTRVVRVSRHGHSKIASEGRTDAPFVLEWRADGGGTGRTMARAVIDASGTWSSPNPLGIDGLPVPGEAELAEALHYGIPDVLGRDRDAFAGRTVLLVGGGHSAFNAVLDLTRLAEREPGTRVLWGLRRDGIGHIIGGGRDDDLPARGELGLRTREAVENGRIKILAPFAAERISRRGAGFRVDARIDGRRTDLDVDRVTVATGFRPDLSVLSELRVELDPIVEAPSRLAPLIDPNLHSCGTVPPHGADILSHPEPNLFVVGMKSYGRAPTFLMTTGYEQVRSIAAALAGDAEAAARVELALPATGVCGGAGTGCCAPSERRPMAACCG